MAERSYSKLIVDNRYHVSQRLGVGATAQVYRAYDTNDHGYRAIKFLDSFVGADEGHVKEILGRFRREVKTLEELGKQGHPGIIGYCDHGVFAHEGQATPYLVMELADGENAEEILDRDGAFSPRDAAWIGVQVLDALTAVHAMGICHRDVKPGNIIISASGVAKISDFGLVRIVVRRIDATADDALTSTGVRLGTPSYLAPEQARGEKVDQRADIYGVGATLFDLVADRPPFVTRETMVGNHPIVDLFYQHVYEPPPRIRDFRPDCPLPLDRAIGQMLAKRPAQRFRTAEAAARALRSVLADRRVPTKNDRYAPSHTEFAATEPAAHERAPWLRGTALAGVVVGVIAAALWLLSLALGR